MVLWLLINVALPFVPLGVIWGMSRALRWNKGILKFVEDGQLYFFSVTLLSVFAYDGLKAKKFETEFFLALLFPILIIPIFYGVSIYLTHSPAGASRDEDLKTLAKISILITVVTVAIISYARWSLGLTQ